MPICGGNSWRCCPAATTNERIHTHRGRNSNIHHFFSQRIAVVGSGISGLAAAHFLAKSHAVTLFESAPRLGGHTNTVDIEEGGQVFGVDTGFRVFNTRTYPNLIALFDELDSHLLGQVRAVEDLAHRAP
jgi:phytoene dehydrogenase-like protein